MSRVDINGEHHQVVIEADAPLNELVDAARKLWDDTRQTQPHRLGPASAGFTAERSPTWDHDTKAPIR
jgi:hypothetical protein